MSTFTMLAKKSVASILLKSFEVCFVALLISSCGGGGDGSAPPTLISSASELNFEGIAGNSIAQQSIQLTLKTETGTVDPQISSSNPAVAGFVLTITGDKTAVLTVTPSSGLAPGEYHAVVKINLHRDQNLSAPVAVYSYPVHIKVYSLDLTPGSLSFSLLEGATATANLDHPSYQVLPARIGTVSSYNLSGSGSFLSFETAPESGRIKVLVNAAGASEGTRSAMIQVEFLSRGNGQRVGTAYVPVEITIGAGLAVPAEQSLALSLTSTQASLSGSVPILANGSSNGGWTAISSASWLVLSSNSGSFPGQLGYSVDLSAISQLDLTRQNEATVTIATAGLLPATFKVLLNSRLPQTFAALPVGISAGINQQVNIGGNGFLALSDPANQVMVTGAQVSSVQVLSDKLLKLDLTAPSAGKYPVTIPGLAGVSINSAQILVAPSRNMQAAVVPIAQGSYVASLWDPLQGAVFLLDYSAHTVTRLKFTAGSWQSASVPIPFPLSMAISPNTGNLYVSTRSNLFEIDTSTLATVSQYPAIPYVTASVNRALVPVSLEGSLLVPSTAYRFDINRKVFSQANLPATISLLDYGNYFGAADGSFVLLSSQASYNSSYIVRGNNVVDWIPVSGKDFSKNTKISAKGNEILTDEGNLYDPAFNLLGTLPPAISSDWVRAKALSPDGSKILLVTDHFQDAAKLNFQNRTLEIYSTKTFVNGTTQFQKLSSVAMNSVLSTCIPPYYSFCYLGDLFVTSDGLSALWVSDNNLEVIVLP